VCASRRRWALSRHVNSFPAIEEIFLARAKEQQGLSRVRETETDRGILKRLDPAQSRRDATCRREWAGRATMNFWLPYRNHGSASRRSNRNPFARPLQRSFILPRRFEVAVEGAEGRQGRRRSKRAKETRARSGRLEGLMVVVVAMAVLMPVVDGGCRRSRRKSKRDTERERCGENGGWRQIESRARRDRPREHREPRLYAENHDTTAAHNTYYPRSVEVVALGNDDVFLVRRHRRRWCRRRDSRRIGFSSSRVQRRRRRRRTRGASRKQSWSRRGVVRAQEIATALKRLSINRVALWKFVLRTAASSGTHVLIRNPGDRSIRAPGSLRRERATGFARDTMG